jgi:hypothetical protein
VAHASVSVCCTAVTAMVPAQYPSQTMDCGMLTSIGMWK